MTQAIRPAALVERQVEALQVVLLHVPPPGAVAAAAPVVLPVPAHLRLQVRLVVSLPVVLPVPVVLVGQVVPLAASAHPVRLLVLLPEVVVQRLALPAVATTGH